MDGWMDGIGLDLRVGGGIEHLTVLIIDIVIMGDVCGQLSLTMA